MASFTLTGLTPPTRKAPTALLTTDKEFAVLGAIVVLDGRSSIDPGGSALTYSFSFVAVPIGSRVALEGFRSLSGDGGSVSFAPDIVGPYVIGLVVSNDNFSSSMATVTVDVRALMVPHARGIVPDGKFIWSYLRDVWTQVEGREFFETLWSALIQISGGELLKLYQNDFNKSIADTQDEYQRRWLSYEPKLTISEDAVVSFGSHGAGWAASTGSSLSSINALTDLVTIPLSEASAISGLVPGRLVVINGEAKVITRVFSDSTIRIPSITIAVDSRSLIPGINGLPWRTPHTITSASQNFEELGVSSGDTIVFSLSDEAGITVDLPFQVDGVVGNKLGVVLATEDLVDGVIPEIPASVLLAISDRFSINSVNLLPDGSVSLKDEAAELNNSASSVFFKNRYWNSDLTADSAIVVGSRTFYITPKFVIRNRLIPIDSTVRSIPALQEYIKQPTVETSDNIYYSVNGEKRVQLPREPVVLTENLSFVVDDETAFHGTLTFRTGTDLIDADGGDFVDRGLRRGDTFTIESPLVLQGDYKILAVLSRNKLLLARKVPLYPLALHAQVKVKITRKTTGRFVRFIPGLFSASSPAPDRLWAEVTFFDNGENIERNFGILVGLTQKDIEDISANATYRQAVAGLMFAYVSGSAVDKIRLGASLLLGLPFTEKRGIIRSIDTNYRLDASGDPIMGRILVEDLGDDNSPSGLSRIYTFPIDTQSVELSGVDDNPATGSTYKVGDVVEAFSSLAKGVQIRDYSISAVGLTGKALLQRYHSTRVRINDNIFNTQEIALVSSFLRKITPSYIALYISSVSEFYDEPDVSDKLRLRYGFMSLSATSPFTDFVGLNSSAIPSFDIRAIGGIPMMYWDKAPHTIRRAGRTLVFQSTSSDPSSTTLRLPEGGLLAPRDNHEVFEAPLCRDGDALIINGGLNDGYYENITVLTDSTLRIDGILANVGPMHFAVVRKVSPGPEFGSIASIQNLTYTDNVVGKDYSYSVVDLGTGGLRNLDIAAGDWFITDPNDTQQTSRHTIVGVYNSTVDFPASPNQAPPFDRVVIVPAISDTWRWAVLSPTEWAICRPNFFSNPVLEESAETGTSTPVVSALFKALMDVGDEVEFVTDSGGTQRRVILGSFGTGVMLDSSVGTGTKVLSLHKKSVKDLSLPVMMAGESSRPGIRDEVLLTVRQVVGVTSDLTVTGAAVTGYDFEAAGVRQGDFLLALSGASLITNDIGYGPGRFPIKDVSATGLTLITSAAIGPISFNWAVLRRN